MRTFPFPSLFNIHLLRPLILPAAIVGLIALIIIYIVGFREKHLPVEYFIFSDQTHTLRCLERGGEHGYKNLAQALSDNHCIAGCNGGFFLDDNSPAGLLISNGNVSGTTKRKSPSTSATLFAENGTIQIMRSHLFNKRKTPRPSNLLQTGPFLIENGVKASGFINPYTTRRTFIATDGTSRWLIGYVPNASLSQLAGFLSKKDAIPGFDIKTAINLDGGSSSALWINDGEKHLSIPEEDPVANYLGIIVK